MDIQFWIWLIVIVVTLIARASNKKSAPARPADRNFDEPVLEESKPISFEDLLREIQASKAPKSVTPKPVVVSKPKPDYVDYDDDIEDEIKPTKKLDYRSEDEIYETYEKAKREAFKRPSLEDTLKLEDTNMKFEKLKGFQHYEIEGEKPISKYVKELRNPSSFKRAFILSEILNRKY
ncbi:MAG: hypothetical protein JNM78_18245 [Cyclobacteriaceae bacterium]|nr:hypothetical protein [Cyclobacteriaceae bacterium]